MGRVTGLQGNGDGGHDNYRVSFFLIFFGLKCRDTGDVLCTS